MIDVLFAILIGMFFGTLTGLVPGLHTNTIALIIASVSTILLSWFSPIAVASFLVAMVVVHSFLDFIPSIFLGAPEDATALGVLPGHKLLLKGLGFRALKLTIIGGIGTFLISLIVLPFVFLWLEQSYIHISKIIAPLLIAFSIIFILQETKLMKIIWAAIIFILAGTLGVITLNYISVKQPLFPLLSGLFGTSTLIISLLNKQKIPPQKTEDKICWLTKGKLLSYFKAALSSLFVSVLPAVGAAQAAVISRAFTKSKDGEEFLVVIGGINTAGALFTLTTLFLLGKTRTGVMAVLANIIELTLQQYLFLLVVCFVAMIFGVVIAIKIGRWTAQNITRINYKKLSLRIIAFLSILAVGFSGFLGLYILIIATAIGIIAPIVKVRRIHLMACLVIPVVLYYI
jgi:putative membrane protein